MRMRLFATLITVLLLAGCNTMEGMGRDIERGGEKLQDKAEDVRR